MGRLFGQILAVPHVAIEADRLSVQNLAPGSQPVDQYRFVVGFPGNQARQQPVASVVAEEPKGSAVPVDPARVFDVGVCRDPQTPDGNFASGVPPLDLAHRRKFQLLF